VTTTSEPRSARLRVGLLGYGAINRAVAGQLVDGAVPGACLSAVLTRHPSAVPAPFSVDDVHALVVESDVVVEAAGHDALAAYGCDILEGGCDLLAVSIGALVDAALLEMLDSAGPGRLLLTSGAIGGLDLLQAAARAGNFDRVALTTTKRSADLVQPWMNESERARICGGSRVEVFRGTAVEAARLFPRSLNVAAAVALAVGSWDLVEVTLISDASASTTAHRLEASGPTGDYAFELCNVVSSNPATSALTAHAALRGIASLTGVTRRFV
jgi:aspartate dehydrogenase